MGVTSILNTAKQALLAQQAALEVVGQNIANVNTPGYSRERPVMLPAQPALTSKVFKFGVDVDHVQRIFDQFIGTQVNIANANFQSAQTQDDLLGQIEALFNDLGLEDGGFASNLDNFFQAFQELANNPQGIPERTVLQQRGTVVATAFHDLRTGLEDLSRGLNGRLKDDLADINHLTSQIADLNMKIQQMEVDAKNPANTLRDQRDLLLKQLSEDVGITSFESDNGQLTILLGSGRPLIEGARANRLVLRADANNPEKQLVRMQDSQGNIIDVSSSIKSGKIYGLQTVRDILLPDFTATLDRLAAQLTTSVNQVHTNGFGLDGSTGTNFFRARQATGQAMVGNRGGGRLQSVTIFDPPKLTLDDYRITFSSNGPPPTFDIVDTTTGEPLATGQTYTSGAPVRFAGLEVVIADGGNAPQVGDTFLVSTTKDTAKHIAVDSGILHDPRKIAAAGTPLPGDNATALAVAQLRDAQAIDGTTFSEFYNNLVSRVGLEKQNSARQAEQRQLVVTEIENRRESLSGVSLDEEQLDLIRFQQAFAAAANFVQVADDMAQTMLRLVQ